MTKEKLHIPKVWLSTELCEVIYNIYRPELNKIGQNLPSFETRYSGRLESILESIKIRSDYEKKDVLEISVSYFTKLVKSQAFIDGNKRSAVIFTNVFLRLNNLKLKIEERKLYEIAVVVAKATEIKDDEAIKLLTPFFRQKTTKLN